MTSEQDRASENPYHPPRSVGPAQPLTNERQQRFGIMEAIGIGVLILLMVCVLQLLLWLWIG